MIGTNDKLNDYIKKTATELNLNYHEILFGVINLIYDNPRDNNTKEFILSLIEKAGRNSDFYRSAVLRDFIIILRSNNTVALQDAFWYLNIRRKYC